MTPTKRLTILIAALVVASSSVLAGCYTLFRHPRLAKMDYRRPASNHCIECHTSASLWRFSHPARLPRTGRPWSDYYDAPWWYEGRWGIPADSTRRPAPQEPAPQGGRP